MTAHRRLAHFEFFGKQGDAYPDFIRVIGHLVAKMPTWLFQPFQDLRTRLTGQSLGLIYSMSHAFFYIVD